MTRWSTVPTFSRVVLRVEESRLPAPRDDRSCFVDLSCLIDLSCFTDLSCFVDLSWFCRLVLEGPGALVAAPESGAPKPTPAAEDPSRRVEGSCAGVSAAWGGGTPPPARCAPLPAALASPLPLADVSSAGSCLAGDTS
jgi:hypothetical protein